MTTRSPTTRHDGPVTRRESLIRSCDESLIRSCEAGTTAVPVPAVLLLIVGCGALAAIAREVSQQITSDNEEDIRRQVASWVAARAKHREQEPDPVSWQRALTHGFGGLLDFFPDLDDQPDESSMGQRALSSATPRETSRAVNASRQIG
jgi:hypothetical protein